MIAFVASLLLAWTPTSNLTIGEGCAKLALARRAGTWLEGRLLASCLRRSMTVAQVRAILGDATIQTGAYLEGGYEVCDYYYDPYGITLSFTNSWAQGLQLDCVFFHRFTAQTPPWQYSLGRAFYPKRPPVPHEARFRQ